MRVAGCPLRYVLDDQLTGVCSELALADGDRLSACLDLIHIPAAEIWLEWDDCARGTILADPDVMPEKSIRNVRAGALISADRSGRCALLRTFWSDEIDGPCLAPIETHLKLDGGWSAHEHELDVFDGGLTRVIMPGNDGLNALLECIRFRFDPQWAEYYRQVAASDADRTAVLRSSLATVARDMPLILAFSLLLGTRNGLEARRVGWARLNRSRVRKRRPPLLDHLEVSCPLVPAARGLEDSNSKSAGLRRRPRLHYVRGHLVRRENEVFWRMPHVRGRSSIGRIASRTVTLSFGPKGNR
jgi:hypothetical protein